jgi:hypothetical protein
VEEIGRTKIGACGAGPALPSIYAAAGASAPLAIRQPDKGAIRACFIAFAGLQVLAAVYAA